MAGGVEGKLTSPVESGLVHGICSILQQSGITLPQIQIVVESKDPIIYRDEPAISIPPMDISLDRAPVEPSLQSSVINPQLSPITYSVQVPILSVSVVSSPLDDIKTHSKCLELGINVPHISPWRESKDEKVITPWNIEFATLASAKNARYSPPAPFEMRDVIFVYCWKGHKTKIISGDIRLRYFCGTCGNDSKWLNARKKFLDVIAVKGGSILEEYNGSLTPISMKCKYNHIWTTTPCSISCNGTWCPGCSGKCPIEAKRNFEEIVRNKRGRLLGEYRTAKDKVEIVCEFGHRWSAVPNSISSYGSWCPGCSGRCPIEARMKFEEVVKNKGGRVLGEYRYSHCLVEVTCEFGHIWSVTPTSISSYGSWCPRCADNCPIKARLKFETMVRSKNGTLLGEYKSAYTKIGIVCELGHTWSVTPGSISQGSWCPACSNHCPIEARKKFEKAVEKRGGRVSGEYKSTQEKVAVTCGFGHTWSVIPDCISQGGWCPVCRESRGERLVAEALESLKIPFVRQWSFPHSKLRYDFHTPYGLIEFDGLQHFREVPHFHRDEGALSRQQARDKQKNTDAMNNKIAILRIDYTYMKKSVLEVATFIDAAFRSREIQYYTNLELYRHLWEPTHP